MNISPGALELVGTRPRERSWYPPPVLPLELLSLSPGLGFWPGSLIQILPFLIEEIAWSEYSKGLDGNPFEYSDHASPLDSVEVQDVQGFYDAAGPGLFRLPGQTKTNSKESGICLNKLSITPLHPIHPS